jgi:hypothetical protein
MFLSSTQSEQMVLGRINREVHTAWTGVGKEERRYSKCLEDEARAGRTKNPDHGGSNENRTQK